MEGMREERREKRERAAGSGAMGLSQMPDETIWTKAEPGL